MDEENEPRTRGRPRSAEKEAAIADAAMHLFLERGFEGTSVDAVAEAAGVSKVTIYARFGDKESLFRAALQRKCATFMASDAFALPGKRDTRANLIEIGRGFLELILSPQSVDLYRAMAVGHGRDRKMSELFFHHAVGGVKERVAGFLAAETERGTLVVTDPDGAAWRYLGAVNNEPFMRAVLGLSPMAEADLARHVEACADDLIRAHRP